MSRWQLQNIFYKSATLIANGKKSSIVRIYGLKTMVVMALQLMGLFSFRVKVCVEADISHLIQHLLVSRLSIFWTDLCLLGTCGKVFSIHSLRKPSLHILNTAVSRQIFLLPQVNTKTVALDTSRTRYRGLRIEDYWELSIFKAAEGPFLTSCDIENITVDKLAPRNTLHAARNRLYS